MRDFLTKFHLKNIRKHQQQHQELSSIVVSALQTCAANLSCTECYPPSAYNDLGRFGQFWTWYSTTYQATSFSKITQNCFLSLASAGRTAARAAV